MIDIFLTVSALPAVPSGFHKHQIMILLFTAPGAFILFSVILPVMFRLDAALLADTVTVGFFPAVVSEFFTSGAYFTGADGFPAVFLLFSAYFAFAVLPAIVSPCMPCRVAALCADARALLVLPLVSLFFSTYTAEAVLSIVFPCVRTMALMASGAGAFYPVVVAPGAAFFADILSVL